MARLPILNSNKVVELDIPELSSFNKNVSNLVENVKNLVDATEERSKDEAEQTESTTDAIDKLTSSVSSSNFGNYSQGSNRTRSQSIMNLSASGILRDTVGDIRDRTIQRFQNNSIVRFGMNVNNAVNAFRGRSTSGALNNRREISQEKLEENREKVKREEKTNELLESILKALVGDKNIELPKNESFITKLISNTLPYFMLGKALLTALGIGAIAGLGAWLADNNMASVANNIKRFFDVVKNLNLPDSKSLKNFKTKITGIGTWLDDLKLNFNKIILNPIETKFVEKINAVSDFFKNLKTNILEKFTLPKIDTSLKDLWSSMSDFFKKIRTDILEKYPLPKIDKQYENLWKGMTEFFKNTNKIKLIDIPNAGIIRSVSELFSGITNKFNEIIEQGKKLLPSIKIPDNLKLPVNTKLLGTIPRSLPKALASNSSSTLPRGSQVVTSAVQQTNKMNPGLEFLSNAGNKGLKLLGRLGLLAGIYDIGTNVNNPETITGVKDEDATPSDRIGAGIKAWEVNFGFGGLIDLFRGEDNRRTSYEMDKLTGNLPVPLRFIANALLANNMREKYTVKDLDVQTIDEATKLIAKEEQFRPDAYLETYGGENLKWKDGSQRYAIGYGFNTINDIPVKKDDTITKEKADEILKEKIEKIDSNIKAATRHEAGEIYKNIDNVARRATLISMGYHMGMGGTMEGNKSKAGLIGSDQKPLWDAIKQANENDKWKNVRDTLLKLPESERFIKNYGYDKEGNRRNTRFDRNANQMESGTLPSAKYGNIAYRPQKIAVGDYIGVKQNPELTLAMSDLEDKMFDFSERIADMYSQVNQKNSNILMMSYYNRMEKTVKNSTDMEKRISTLENMQNKRQIVSVPVMNNVVDNTQINNSNQSILVKKNVSNGHNPFLMLA